MTSVDDAIKVERDVSRNYRAKLILLVKWTFKHFEPLNINKPFESEHIFNSKNLINLISLTLLLDPALYYS